MDSDMIAFLEKHPKCPPAALFTHEILGGSTNPVRYNLPLKSLMSFWLLYCNKVDEESELCLGQRVGRVSPLFVNFRLKFHLTQKSNTDEFLINLVYLLQKIIDENYKLKTGGREHIVVILKKEDLEVQGDIFVEEFEFRFPYFLVETSELRSIKEKLMSEVLHRNTMSCLESQPINSWDDILTFPEEGKSWCLYGSKDDKDKNYLVISNIWGKLEDKHIYDVDISELDGTFPYDEMIEIFDLRLSKFYQQQILTDEIIDKYGTEFWKPLWLSNTYYSIVCMRKENKEVNKNRDAKPKRTSRSEELPSNDEDDPTDLELAKFFLTLLKPEKANKKSYWLDIGRALYDCSKEDDPESGLDMWIRFTKRGSVFSEKDCMVYYPTFRSENKGITVKTLAWFAKHDNPHRYNRWHKQWVFSSIGDAVLQEEAQVAKTLYRQFWLEYICVGGRGKGKWYYYRGNIWRPSDNAVQLSSAIRKEFIRTFDEYRMIMNRKKVNSEDERDIALCEKLISATTRKIKRLSQNDFQRKVIMQSIDIDYFYHETFPQLNNMNENIIGVLNGVIETTDTEAIFRKGKPEDYVSMCSPIYYSEIDRNDEYYKQLQLWLHQCFPDPTLRRYFLKIMSSCLIGRNSDKLFPIFTGKGDNSKSMIKKLLEATFGPYCFTFPTSLFTSRRGNSASPSPQIAHARYARIATFEEPEDGSVLNMGLIKKFTGGDSFFSRFLQDNGMNTVPMFLLILFCNKIPSITSPDEATKNRTCIVPFLSKWVEKDIAPEDPDEQMRKRRFIKDKHFEPTIPYMAPAFLWLLVRTYSEYRREGLRTPRIVEKCTADHWEKTDYYYNFIKESLENVMVEVSDIHKPTEENPSRKDEKTGKMYILDKDSIVTVREVYIEFARWWRESEPSRKPPDLSTFKYNMSQRLPEPENNKWWGVKLKREENSGQFGYY